MENLYKKIVETVPVFFFVWDSEKNKAVFINEKFYDHTLDQYYTPDTPKEDLRQYIAKDSQDAYDSFFKNLVNKVDTTHHIELKAVNLPGIEWIKINTFPIPEENGSSRYITGHISDVTHAREYNQLLEQQVDSIDTIIFMLAHELSSPIANMMGLAEYLRVQSQMGHYIQPTQLYETIYNRGGEVLTLARGMISLLNFQFNKDSFVREKIILKPFVEELIENFYHKSTAKNVTISCSAIDSDIEAEVQTEKFSNALEEILVFLLKMANRNDVISFSTSSPNQSDQMRLCITSSAANLPERPIHLLLDRSARLSLSDVKGHKIRGMLELVIAKEIVELHQGQLELLNEDERQGFVITIPPHTSR